MADEHNENTENENTSTQNKNDGEVKKVDMTQEELNALINKKFASGAEKAKTELLNSLGVESEDTLKDLIEAKKQQEEANKTELEKLQEQLNALNSEKEKLYNDLTSTQKRAKLNEIALKNGIEDLEYLEFKYSKASQEEGFDETTFLEEFTSNSNVMKKTTKTDSSSNKNNEVNDFATQISNITSLKDLERIQRKL